MSDPQTILIVDDTPANLTVLSTMLTQHGYRVRPAINGQLAIASVSREQPDLILLDIKMPEMDGYEVCARLKADEHTRDIPILFISALDDIEDKVKAFQVGGVDYITKPFHVEEVLARVRAHITLQNQRRHIAQLSSFKDELLRIVSHDLKNPISTILGYAELMQEEGISGDHADYVERIKRSAKFMFTLVSDLLELSQAEGDFPLELRQVDLRGVIGACAVNHEFAAHNKSISLACITADTPLIVLVDELRFNQVINNLISNAIKYTPAGGQIEIRVYGSGDQAVVEVADSGLGIPADALARIFDKFYRVNTREHMAVSGTGLGLPIAKVLVEKHGGRIGVSSELGVGSVFTVTLPLVS
jgi:two-component system sensor histidine kinase/response regulator